MMNVRVEENRDGKIIVDEWEKNYNKPGKL